MAAKKRTAAARAYGDKQKPTYDITYGDKSASLPPSNRTTGTFTRRLRAIINEFKDEFGNLPKDDVLYANALDAYTFDVLEHYAPGIYDVLDEYEIQELASDWANWSKENQGVTPGE